MISATVIVAELFAHDSVAVMLLCVCARAMRLCSAIRHRLHAAWSEYSAKVGDGGATLWERERSKWVDWRLRRRSDDRDIGKKFGRKRAKDLAVVKRRQAAELKVTSAGRGLMLGASAQRDAVSSLSLSHSLTLTTPPLTRVLLLPPSPPFVSLPLSPMCVACALVVTHGYQLRTPSLLNLPPFISRQRRRASMCVSAVVERHTPAGHRRGQVRWQAVAEGVDTADPRRRCLGSLPAFHGSRCWHATFPAFHGFDTCRNRSGACNRRG
jgi:hypothetical protein